MYSFPKKALLSFSIFAISAESLPFSVMSSLIHLNVVGLRPLLLREWKYFVPFSANCRQFALHLSILLFVTVVISSSRLSLMESITSSIQRHGM